MPLDNEDIKQLIAILQKGLTEKDHEDIKETQKVNKKVLKNKSERNNLFEKMSESSMHKDDVAIDRKLKKFPPTERSRSYTPVNAKCRVCGKQEQVNLSLVESIERYKCNKCSTSAG